jgi:hypothetical protein
VLFRSPGGLYHKFWEKDGTAEEDTPVLTDGYWMGALPYVGAGNTIRTQEDVFGQYKGGMDICSLRRHSKRHSNVVLINGSCQELDIREELWELPWHRDYLKPYGSNIELARPDACKPQNSGDRPWLFE